MTTYRVISVNKKGEMVGSYQCDDQMEAAILMAKIEQTGLDAKCWKERN